MNLFSCQSKWSTNSFQIIVDEKLEHLRYVSNSKLNWILSFSHILDAHFMFYRSSLWNISSISFQLWMIQNSRISFTTVQSPASIPVLIFSHFWKTEINMTVFFQTIQTNLELIGFKRGVPPFNKRQTLCFIEGSISGFLFYVYILHVAKSPKEYMAGIWAQWELW